MWTCNVLNTNSIKSMNFNDALNKRNYIIIVRPKIDKKPPIILSLKIIIPIQNLRFYIKQANSKNCGPPPGNKFDFEIGQRSRSWSPHGTNRKGLSQ